MMNGSVFSMQVIAFLVMTVWIVVGRSSPINKCENVRQMYQLSAHHHHHPNHNHHHHAQRSQQLNCEASANPSSCCHGLDDNIAAKASDDFEDQLEAVLKMSTFENHFIGYYNRIHRKLERILNDTIADIDEYFGPNQDRIVQANRQLVELIRGVIFESKHLTPVQLDDHIDHLLEAIFIGVLQQTHENKFPSEYESCLLNTMKDSDILGKTREEMLFRFSRTIDMASLIVHSLENSLQLINQTSEIKTIKPDCIRQLSRSFHCWQCATATNWPSIIGTCASSCRQTMQQCLQQTHLQRLDSTIKTLHRSYQQLVNLMVNYFNPEILMSSHRQSIQQAQQWIRSKNDKIAKNARIACGSLKRYFRSAGIVMATGKSGGNAYDFYNYSSTTSSPANDHLDDNINAQYSLYVSIQSMAHLFAKHKDMFAHLDDKMCGQYSDENCWNGSHTVSSYQGKQHQSSISLANANKSDDAMIITLHDRVKQSETTIQELLIHNQRSSRFSQSMANDQQVVDDTDNDQPDDGSGDGSGANPMYDDEDYNYQESSGHLPRLSDHDDQQHETASSTDDTISTADIIIDPINKVIASNPKQHADSSAMRMAIMPNLIGMLILSYSLWLIAI